MKGSKEAYKEYKAVEEKLAKNVEEQKKLKLKKDEFDSKIRELERKIDRSNSDIKDATVKNIKGLLSDEDLQKVREEISSLNENLKMVVKQREIADQVEEDIVKVRLDLSRHLVRARSDFLWIMARDLLSDIPDKTRELITEAWSYVSRTGNSGYEKFLMEVFPKENINDRDARWARFIEKHVIEH